jgi:hypothetical protein
MTSVDTVEVAMKSKGNRGMERKNVKKETESVSVKA